jgi:sugar lactone lactonase YvrE
VTADNSTLIIAESFAGKLTAFDIAADGSLRNRRVWADVFSDGICLDAEGAVWGPSWRDGRPGCIRVDEGGRVRQWIETDRACFACMLGGDDGTTLFMLAADWHMNEDFADNLRRLTSGPRTGQLLTADVSVPGAGWP